MNAFNLQCPSTIHQVACQAHFGCSLCSEQEQGLPGGYAFLCEQKVRRLGHEAWGWGCPLGPELTWRWIADRREQLDNHRLLRSSYLLGAIIYVSALTYSQLILSPAQLTVGQVFGLLLAYFVVAVVCWSMAVALVPFFEGILMDYNTILAAIIFVLYSLFCNYGHYLGVTQGINHHERLVAYVSAHACKFCAGTRNKQTAAALQPHGCRCDNPCCTVNVAS